MRPSNLEGSIEVVAREEEEEETGLQTGLYSIGAKIVEESRKCINFVNSLVVEALWPGLCNRLRRTKWYHTIRVEIQVEEVEEKETVEGRGRD